MKATKMFVMLAVAGSMSFVAVDAQAAKKDPRAAGYKMSAAEFAAKQECFEKARETLPYPNPGASQIDSSNAASLYAQCARSKGFRP